MNARTLAGPVAGLTFFTVCMALIGAVAQDTTVFEMIIVWGVVLGIIVVGAVAAFTMGMSILAVGDIVEEYAR